MIRDLQKLVKSIAEKGGRFTLIIGMSFFEGLSRNVYHNLTLLHDIAVQGKGGSGVRFVYSNTYHGKVYRFVSLNTHSLYIGSSNLSVSGLSGNIECMAKISDQDTVVQVNNFLDFLCTDEVSKPIHEVEITIKGEGKYKKYSTPELSSTEAMRYDTNLIQKPKTEPIHIVLENLERKQKSGLNTYFGKGRLSRSSGRITPRNWFEVEIISNTKTTSDSKYPKGNFVAYTDDGYVFQCKTQGDNYKNLRSTGSLEILGKWIKGKLQKAGALHVYERVTSQTLDQYGNDTINLYPRADGSYYMEFLPCSLD